MSLGYIMSRSMDEWVYVQYMYATKNNQTTQKLPPYRNDKDHVYYWHPRSSVDRYWRSTPRSILAIDTSIDTGDRHLDRPVMDTQSTSWLTLGRPSVNPLLTHGRHLGWQTFNFRWHSMEWRSILAMTTRSMLVDVSIATLRSAVSRMSVFCQWCIGSMLVMYSSQYPSSNGGIPPNTPSASVRSKSQLFLVIFCVSKIKLLWRQSCISNKIINLHEVFIF